MDMRGQQHIPASREVVWIALNDPEILRVCIPGCQELTKSSDTEMTAVAVIKVGPVTARFQGAVTLSDLDPSNGYKISGEGQGGVAGFAKGTAIVRLEADGNGTLLHYEVDVQIGGKLSQLGGRLIDATAKKMSGLFFQKFAQEIQDRQHAAEDATAVAAAGAPPGAVGPAAFAKPSAPTQASDRQSVRRHAPVPSTAIDHPSGLFSFLKLVGAIAVVGAIGLAWYRYGGLLPSLVPASDTIAADGRAHVSPDMSSTIQLIMAAAIGYLFGARNKSHQG
ncbi:carbon monoxide dehydrogenase subunit G [Bradyrhizobium sp. AZCC 1577]|uniref:SRPBCC family protein n=1 Tax=Bradyrhizobium sp. AZCC 1577 TaxID=3117019 RepID=UPI002FF431A2